MPAAVTSCKSPLLSVLLITLLSAVPALARGPHKTEPLATVLEYRTVVPMGLEAYTLKPQGRSFYVMASAVNPSFDGWRVMATDAEQKQLLDASGMPVLRYPSHLTFRVSASAHGAGPALSVPRDLLRAAYSLNDYLLNLKFRIAIFRGLHSRIVQPRDVHMIGVPPDLPYDERIYLVEFDTLDIPVSDRIVLEVLDPKGERIGRFHLDLY